jgi:Outer membrane protein beta-barrel domain
MRSTIRAALLVLITLSASGVLAQSNELAVTVGGKFTTSGNFNIDPSFAIEGSYAGRIIHLPLASFYFELPVAAGLKSTSSNPFSCEAIISPQCAASSFKTSALFVAPGLKLKLAPEFPVSPYFTVGGGVAHFRGESSNGNSTTNNTGVVAFGGGLDFKIAPFISFRGEIRDFYSGRAFTPVIGPSTRLHNIFTTGGIVLRF